MEVLKKMLTQEDQHILAFQHNFSFFQKNSTLILCRRDIYNTGLHIWHVKLAAQGIFKDVQVKRNNENCVNISNVVFNQSNCEFIVSSETPLQRESTTLLLYIYNSCIVWILRPGCFLRYLGRYLIRSLFIIKSSMLQECSFFPGR